MSIDWVQVLEDPAYEWDYRAAGASDRQLSTLESWFGRPLPDDYRAFLRVSNGAVLWYRDLWHLQIWSAGDVPVWSVRYGFGDPKMPGAIAFADNGGGEGLVFDVRPQHLDRAYPILAVNFVTVGWKEAQLVVAEFRDLLLLRRPLLGQ